MSGQVEQREGRAVEYKHQWVTRQLRERLGPPGSDLPSEAMLETEFGVARGTVRKALETLENEGLITSISGSLRTVRDIKRIRWDMSAWEQRHRAPDADAWTATVTEQGAGDADTVVRVEYVTDADAAEALDLSRDTVLLTRVREHVLAGLPHQLSQSFYPPWVVGGGALFTQPRNVFAPGGLLAASGHPQVRFHDVIAARPPNGDEATALRMVAGTPLLIHTRTGYDYDSRPVRHMVTRMAADRVEVSYDVLNGHE